MIMLTYNLVISINFVPFEYNSINCFAFVIKTYCANILVFGPSPPFSSKLILMSSLPLSVRSGHVFKDTS